MFERGGECLPAQRIAVRPRLMSDAIEEGGLVELRLLASESRPVARVVGLVKGVLVEDFDRRGWASMGGLVADEKKSGHGGKNRQGRHEVRFREKRFEKAHRRRHQKKSEVGAEEGRPV